MTICTVGHPHGLVHLLRDSRGAALVRAKVERWVAMGMGGWNFQARGMSAYSQELLDRWPLPFHISASGEPIKTGHRLRPKTPASNPVREAYRLWGERWRGKAEPGRATERPAYGYGGAYDPGAKRRTPSFVPWRYGR